MTSESLKGLEFLSENEVEVAAAAFAEHFVEAVCPVYTHESDHGELYAHAGTGAAFKLEGVELAYRGPGVAGLEEGEGVDGGALLEHQREVEFEAHAGVGVAFGAPRGERAVVVAAQGYCFGSVGV